MYRYVIRVIITLVLAGLAVPSHAQGTFVNLDFENPVLPLVPDANHMVPVNQAIPGWSAYVGDTQLADVFYNTVSLGAPAVSFHGPGSSRSPFHGSYCVMLQGGFDGIQVVPSAVAQTGQVPATAQSLRFHADNLSLRIVSFDGQDLPVSNLSGGTFGYQEYGVDISAFAGQSGELRLTGGSGLVDYIQFSDIPIPEPSAAGLVMLGMSMLGVRCMRRL